MAKQNLGRAFAGGDVSSKEIVVALQRHDGQRERASFANTAAGHKSLVSWLGKRGAEVQIVIEATGIYSLDVGFALHRAKRIEVMVANPRAIADFARALDATVQDRPARCGIDPPVFSADAFRCLGSTLIGTTQSPSNHAAHLRLEASDAAGSQPPPRGRACG